MTDLDVLIGRLHDASVPDAVRALDGAALAATARQRIAETRRSSAVAASAALMLGVVGSAFPAAPADASTAMPLGGLSALAPSSLLAN